MKILSLASLTVTGPCKPDNGADNSDNWNWIVIHVACAGYSFVKEKNKKGKNVCVDFASHTPARTPTGKDKIVCIICTRDYSE